MSNRECKACGKPLGDAHDAEMYHLAQMSRLGRWGKSLRDPANLTLEDDAAHAAMLDARGAIRPERQDFEANRVINLHNRHETVWKLPETAWNRRETPPGVHPAPRDNLPVSRLLVGRKAGSSP